MWKTFPLNKKKCCSFPTLQWRIVVGRPPKHHHHATTQTEEKRCVVERDLFHLQFSSRSFNLVLCILSSSFLCAIPLFPLFFCFLCCCSIVGYSVEIRFHCFFFFSFRCFSYYVRVGGRGTNTQHQHCSVCFVMFISGAFQWHDHDYRLLDVFGWWLIVDGQWTIESIQRWWHARALLMTSLWT